MTLAFNIYHEMLIEQSPEECVTAPDVPNSAAHEKYQHGATYSPTSQYSNTQLVERPNRATYVEVKVA